MIDPGDEVHRAAAACVKVGVKRIAVRIDGYQHPLTVGIAFKNQLLRLHQYIAVAAPAQRFAACAGILIFILSPLLFFVLISASHIYLLFLQMYLANGRIAGNVSS